MPGTGTKYMLFITNHSITGRHTQDGEIKEGVQAKTDLRSLQGRAKRYKLLKKSRDTKGRIRSLKYAECRVRGITTTTKKPGELFIVVIQLLGHI